MQKNQAIAIGLIALLSLSIRQTYARDKTYQTGKLISIESPETPVALPLPSGQTLDVPVHVLYKFEIQVGDLWYVGSCLKKEYKAQWRVRDAVQFRLNKDKMYLRRPKRGELVLEFLRSAKLGPDAKPITVVSFKDRKI
jgi:hypothetical protein